MIHVENVGKKFSKSLKRSMFYGISDIVQSAVGIIPDSTKLREREFWAVDDVSFTVRKGETLGIIGPNGSGKTTLLKMLNGIFMPDRGKIIINGTVGALIAVGAGFHPMLSGRENIYINGTILGMSKKEIDKKFDAIVEFADIGDFIDAPVKYYSSGMYVRLGFSIAINIQPEILLIDEVLSVGDLSFQNKSLEKLAELRNKAHVVVFVSHNLEQVRNLCDRVVILDQGRQESYDDTNEALLRYHHRAQQKRLEYSKKKKGFITFGHVSSGDINVKDGGIIDKDGNKIDTIVFGENISLFVDIEIHKNINNIIFCISILDEKKIICIRQYSNDYDKQKYYSLSKGRCRLCVEVEAPNLMPGVYSPGFAIRNASTGETYVRIAQLDSFSIEGNLVPRGGVIFSHLTWSIVQ
ncbi:MAG: ABC transporter ATP-binding protein [Candidatus Omnitrophica bacterium]|nr:ABC transporter ATP-binding protein [Candidatus Omnitrophota bacterium]